MYCADKGVGKSVTKLAAKNIRTLHVSRFPEGAFHMSANRDGRIVEAAISNRWRRKHT